MVAISSPQLLVLIKAVQMNRAVILTKEHNPSSRHKNAKSPLINHISDRLYV